MRVKNSTGHRGVNKIHAGPRAHEREAVSLLGREPPCPSLCLHLCLIFSTFQLQVRKRSILRKTAEDLKLPLNAEGNTGSADNTSVSNSSLNIQIRGSRNVLLQMLTHSRTSSLPPPHPLYLHLMCLAQERHSWSCIFCYCCYGWEAFRSLPGNKSSVPQPKSFLGPSAESDSKTFTPRSFS